MREVGEDVKDAESRSKVEEWREVEDPRGGVWCTHDRQRIGTDKMRRAFIALIIKVCREKSLRCVLCCASTIAFRLPACRMFNAKCHENK